MKNLLILALSALLLGLAACAGPKGNSDEGGNAAIEAASLPEVRYYMVADA